MQYMAQTLLGLCAIYQVITIELNYYVNYFNLPHTWDNGQRRVI